MKLDEDKLLKFIKRHKDSYYSVYREELSYSQIADLKDFYRFRQSRECLRDRI